MMNDINFLLVKNGLLKKIQIKDMMKRMEKIIKSG